MTGVQTCALPIYLRFCEAHLKAGTVVEQRYDPPRKVTLVMCGHCTARRKIWD